MGPRMGTLPLSASGVQPLDNTSGRRPGAPRAPRSHEERRPALQLTQHYVLNWSQDDTAGSAVDNTKTQAVDGGSAKGRSVDVYGFDAPLNDNTFGSVGIGAPYIRGENAYRSKGFPPGP